MLQIDGLHMEYQTDRGAVRAVRGVSFRVDQGKFYTLLGPSGCGKTSTMRCIAGLETPTRGRITIGEKVVFDTDAKVALPAHQRAVGMVFQSYAIWPHMSVYDNVAFPLQHGRNRVARSLVKDHVKRALDLVQLSHLADRPAPMLSGGQQQRVALARAIVYEPDLLLLDEPLSNLDAKLREEMRQELKQLVGRLGITTLYVTHDQVEALSMSDTLAVMSDGLIVQEGTPSEVYLRPNSAFTANFVGKTNLIPGTVSQAPADPVSSPGRARMGTVAMAQGTFRVRLPEWAATGAKVVVAFRPEAAQVRRAAGAVGPNVLRGTLAATSFVGEVLEYVVATGDETARAKGDPFDALEAGETVDIEVPPERCLVLPPDGGTGAPASPAVAAPAATAPVRAT